MSDREVPQYDQHIFAERASDYALCIFVLNETGKLEPQLEKSRVPCADVDIVIADGGSTDGSTDHGKLKGLGVNTLLVKRSAGKLGAQMRMAFAWALDRGYKGIIAIDGNNKDDPTAVPAFVEALKNGYDHVQGSRFIKGGISENLPFSRWLGVRFLHSPLISLASGRICTDTTNGFRGYSAAFLSDPKVALFRDVFVGYELHYYLAITAAKLGFKTTEIPVARRYPAYGPTPTKISPIKGNARVLGCLFKACIGGYNVPQGR